MKFSLYDVWIRSRITKREYISLSAHNSVCIHLPLTYFRFLCEADVHYKALGEKRRKENENNVLQTYKLKKDYIRERSEKRDAVCFLAFMSLYNW